MTIGSLETVFECGHIGAAGAAVLLLGNDFAICIDGGAGRAFFTGRKAGHPHQTYSKSESDFSHCIEVVDYANVTYFS